MQDDEPKPELNGASDEVEEKVRKMMDPAASAPEPEVKDAKKPTNAKPLKIKILHDDEEPEGTESEVLSAPLIPDPKPNGKKIKILHDDEPEEADEKPVNEPDKVDEKPAVESEDESPDEDSSDEPAEEQSEPEAPTAPEAVVVNSEEPETDTADPTSETTEEPGEEASEAEPEDPPAEAEESKEETPAETEPETPAIDEPLPPEFEDDKTASAIDDIVSKEGDDLLAADDEKLAAAFQPPAKPGIGKKIANLFAAWWHNPKARWLTFTFLFLVFLAACIVPTSRYFLLNTARVRSNLSLLVLDESTQQPLKNVKVSIGGAAGITGSDGRARLSRVKLGPSELVIEKRAFAPVKKLQTVGWGSNPLGEFKLTPTGTQYAFTITDFLSGKPVENVEASTGEASALSDEEGKIRLTIDQPPDELEVNFSGDKLRQEKLKFNADIKTEQTVQVVPVRKEVFISKRTGKFDLYKIDIDGKNEEKVLAGTGTEREDMVLAVHPQEEQVALVSTRDNKRNQDNFLLSTLTLIDLEDNSATSVAQSERIQIVDWIGNKLVYVQITQGASAENPKRHRLMSYDFTSGDNKEIASSNYFNDVMVIGNKVYFAPSSAYQTKSAAGLYKIDADGNNRQTILGTEVWNFFRTSYDHLALSAGKDWFDYHLGDKAPTKLDGQPSNLNSRIYADSLDGKKSLWSENRDGKGVLLAYEIGTQNEQTLRSQSGLKPPLRWLTNSVVVYRINTDQETADYAMSLNGGEPRKIRDVSNIGGVDKWYYY